MSWKGFRDIFLTGDVVGFDLVVDELVVLLASFLSSRIGSEVLFYVKMTRPPVLDGGRIRFYLGFRENVLEEVFIPRQESSFTHVRVSEDNIPLGFEYGVVHTHPPGIRRFSRADIESINVNHTVSLVVSDGEPVDASISFSLAGFVVEARPRISVVPRKLVLSSDTGQGFGELLLREFPESVLEGIFRPALMGVDEKIVKRAALA